jgi:gamma-butyrobetaine dioxygenase
MRAGLLARSRPGLTAARFLSSLVGLRKEPTALHLTLPSLGAPLTLSYDWLRDSCQCAQCVHPSTKQKLVRTGDCLRPVPREATIADGGESVRVEWDDDAGGHESVYPVHFLRRYASGQEARRVSHFDDVLARRAWDVSSLPASRFVDYPALTADPLPGFLQLLRYGILIVRRVPHETTTAGSQGGMGVGELARMIGIVRETFYGRFWDVVSQRGSTNIAYTDLNLDLHMDLM